MRRLPAIALAALVVCAGCTSTSDTATPTATRSTTQQAPSVSLSSLDIAWPRAGSVLDPGDHPAAPDGFDDAMLDRMAEILTTWAGAAAIDEDVWHSAKAVNQVAGALPGPVAKTVKKQAGSSVSPQLAVGNVFAKDVTVVGAPAVTTAWRVSTAKGDGGAPYVLLELQTRTAYEVRVGNGPTRVIGILRVHGLSAFKDTTEDFGVTGGWQEFGAGDCALALDDDLLPDSDPADATKDLATFTKVGDGSKLDMPRLGAEDQVDAEFLRRCRDGSI